MKHERTDNMKKNNTVTDKSAPYRTLGMAKITAPNKPKDEPRGSKITSASDLRGKRE